MITNDEQGMQQAIALARLGEFTARPNPCVGAVIVKNNVCLGEGLHWQAGLAHAEINALYDAKFKGNDVKGATCYVTLEPCSHVGRTPPCTEALIGAGIARVVIGSLDPNSLVNGKGLAALRAAGIEVSPSTDKMKQEAIGLNPGFFSRMERKRPWVRGKIGVSLDGRTAMKSGESQWITSDNSRADVQRWRARSAAIITTATTVMNDKARYNVRAHLGDFPKDVTFQQPLRVIIDKGLMLSPDSAIFVQKGEILIAVHDSIPIKTQEAFLKTLPHSQVRLLSLPLGEDNHLALKGLWDWFYDNNINDVLIEAGPTFLGGMLQTNIIDEMIVYIAPKYLGHEGRPMMVLPGLTTLNQHIGGKFQEVITVDPDIRLRVTL